MNPIKVKLTAIDPLFSKVRLLLIVLSTLIPFSSFAQNPINGSFEYWGATGCQINTTPDSWSNYSNGFLGFDEARFPTCPTTIPPSPEHGNVYARAAAQDATSGEGAYQMISGFNINGAYQISFYYAGSNLYAGSSDIQWHIFIDDVDVAQTPVFHSNDSTWTFYTYNFTATANTHKIGFRLYSVTSFGGSGAMDNLSVSCAGGGPSVTLDVSSIDTLCASNSAVVLNGGSPAGGTYSGVGVTGNSFDPSVTGAGNWPVMYSYTDSTGCSNTVTAFIHVDVCTGVDNQGDPNSIKIYPNPFSENIIISTEVTGTAFIYNDVGQLVMISELQPGTNMITTTSFPEGIYSVQVKSETNSVTKKIIKE